MKIIRSDEKGAGLVLVLIVCSLVGAAALYLMDMNKVSDKKIALDAKILSYRSLVKAVASKIHTGKNCTAALGGTVIDQAFSTQGQSVSLDLKLPMNPKILKKPETVPPGQVPRDVWFLNGGTSVKDVQLFINERVRTPVRLAASGSPVMSAAKGYLLIIPGHPGVGVKLTRGRHYRIPIFIYYSGSGAGATNKRLVSCGDPAGEAFFCTAMGGAYDPDATDPNMRCQPDRTCFPFKAGIVNNAGSCPAPYTAQKLGFNPGGTNNPLIGDLWLCDWCNQNPINPEFKGGSYYVPHPPSPYELEKGVLPETYPLPIVNP